MKSRKDIETLNRAFDSILESQDLHALLSKLSDFNFNSIAFTTSFGAEDQVITHYINQSNLKARIITLDTGRQFQETYSTWSSTLSKYSINIEAYYPNENNLKQWVVENGPNGFYNSIEQRLSCCNMRKIEPLNIALNGVDLWISGLRAEQSNSRSQIELFELDESRNLIKFNPLLNWTQEDVWQTIKQYNIPYNPLHDKAYPSIGCAPCTRPIKEGDDFRAGRWWWENNNKKECGLHN